jgi:hypothetical protein
MQTKLKRVNVSFPTEILTVVEKDSLANHRTIPGQILYILDQWYLEKQRESDLFAPTRLREAKQSDSPHFEGAGAAPPLASERLSAFQKLQDPQRK